jgi:hypothetical protein
MKSAHVGDETLMFPICAPSPDACRAFNIVLLYLLYSTDGNVDPCRFLVLMVFGLNPAKSEIVNTANKVECPKVRRSRVITMK